MGLRNRIVKESQDLKGVNLAIQETKLEVGTFTRLENWIPGETLKGGRTKIKKKRGVALLETEDALPVLPLPCGEGGCPGDQLVPADLSAPLSLSDGTIPGITWASTISAIRLRGDGDLEAYVFWANYQGGTGNYSAAEHFVTRAIWGTDGVLVSQDVITKPDGIDFGNFNGALQHVSELLGFAYWRAGEMAWIFPDEEPTSPVHCEEPPDGTVAAVTGTLYTDTNTVFITLTGAQFGNDIYSAGPVDISGNNHASILRWHMDGSFVEWTDTMHQAPYISGTSDSNIKRIQATDGYLYVEMRNYTTNNNDIIQLDKTTYAILNTWNLDLSIPDEESDGWTVVEDRYLFKLQDPSNDGPFALYGMDITIADTWHEIDADITKVEATQAGNDDGCLFHTVGPDGEIYLAAIFGNNSQDGGEIFVITPYIPCP